MVEKPVNPKCGLRVECVGSRQDNMHTVVDPSFYSVKV